MGHPPTNPHKTFQERVTLSSMLTHAALRLLKSTCLSRYWRRLPIADSEVPGGQVSRPRC